MALEGLSQSELARRGVASITVKEALIPIIQSEIEKLLTKLEHCPNQLDAFMDIRGDLRSIRHLQRELDTNIRNYELQKSTD